MKKAVQKIFSFIKNAGPSQKKFAHKARGQSFVEFAFALPFLLLLLSAAVEYGFMLNYYLSVVDATRDTARRYSGGDPFLHEDEDKTINTGDKLVDFYQYAAEFGEQALDPTKIPLQPGAPAYTARSIPLDPAIDDVIVSVYSIEDDDAIQYPTSGPYHLYPASAHDSRFSEEIIIASRLDIGGGYAPNEGLLVVEIYYNYNHVLGMPFLTMFGDPVELYAYTIMPIREAEPVIP